MENKIQQGGQNFEEYIIKETPFPPDPTTGGEEERQNGDESNDRSDFIPIPQENINKFKVMEFEEEFNKYNVNPKREKYELNPLLDKSMAIQLSVLSAGEKKEKVLVDRA